MDHRGSWGKSPVTVAPHGREFPQERDILDRVSGQYGPL
jgi:hypothetical protein